MTFVILLSGLRSFSQVDTTGSKPEKGDTTPAVEAAAALLAPPECYITGATSVTASNNVHTYTLSCSGGQTATNWVPSCGVKVSQSPTSVNIRWNEAGCTSATVMAYNGTTLYASLNITINIPPLTGGTISNPSQNIGCNTTPAQILASAATGGNCSPTYNYQWKKSTDNIIFTDIPGANSQNYQPGPLTTTTYYKRVVKCDVGGGCDACKAEGDLPDPFWAYTHTQENHVLALSERDIADQGFYSARGPFLADEKEMPFGWQPSGSVYFADSAFTTNTAVVTVTALSSGGSISNPSQTINVNTSPSQITATAAVGGSATYQWMQSINGTSYNDISGATSQNYQPGNLSVTTYFKRKSSCGGTVLYTTNTATVTVLLPQFNAGCVTSSNQSISSGAIPATILASMPTAGSCGGSYTYQWMRSTDNIYFNNIIGATSQNLSFTSGLTQTTYFQRRATCGTESLITTSVTVTVN